MASHADTTRIHVGSSAEPAAAAAARAAAGAALNAAEHPLIGLVFATPQYHPAQLAEALNECFGAVPWTGCTAVGVFAGLELMTKGIVVAVVDCASARAQVGVASGVDVDSYASGRAAVAQALAGMPATPAGRQRLVILLPDTSVASAADVMRGAIGEGGNGVVWAGGGAGDVMGNHTLVQFAAGEAHTNCVVAAAIDLPGGVETGARHGWRPFGPPALVTRARGNTTFELEYRRAFDVYREAAASVGAHVDEASFGEYAMLHPLGIPQANEQYLIRDPVAVEDGALRCVAEVPDGALVRMMRADQNEIVSAAGAAAARARRALGTQPAGALVFDCISRHLILGASFVEELAAFREVFGEHIPVFGCLTFGEVASFEWEVPQFHNKTAVVVAIPSGADSS